VAQKLALQWSARADLRLAEAAVPDRPRHADISRSDLSQSLCSDARRAEEGSDGTVAYKAADCVTPKAARPRMDKGTYSIWSLSASDPPRPRIAQFPGHWEGESSYRSKRHAHRDARRTPQPLYDARQASKEGHDDCGLPRSISTSAKLPEQLRPLPDVGPRQGDVWPQTLHGLPPTCRFTSVIRAVHGSVAATRTPTACCDSTSREEPISRAFSQAYLNGIALRLNQRPRKTLAFENPCQ